MDVKPPQPREERRKKRTKEDVYHSGRRKVIGSSLRSAAANQPFLPGSSGSYWFFRIFFNSGIFSWKSSLRSDSHNSPPFRSPRRQKRWADMIGRSNRPGGSRQLSRDACTS